MIELFPRDPASPPRLYTDAADIRRHLNVDDTSENALLLDLAAAAQRHLEQETRLRFTSRAMTARAAAWPRDGWLVTVGPVQEIASVGYLDPDGVPQTLPPGTLLLREALGVAQLVPETGAVLPETQVDSEITVTLTVGFHAGNPLPDDLRHAVLLLTGHYYRHREATTLVPGSMLAFAIAELTGPYRLKRLQ